MNSDHIIAGDYSKFDKSLIADITRKFVKYINSWYNDGPVNAQIREILWMEVPNSVHLIDNVIYAWKHALASGQNATVWINSLYNLVALVFSYGNTHPAGRRGIREFFSHVFPQVFGDDNLFSVSPVSLMFFNQTTITEDLKKLNLIYTSEDKKTNVAPFRKLSEVTFLKRSFRYDDYLDRYVAPLELEVILEMAYWTKLGVHYHEIQQQNVDTVLMELSLHDPIIFDTYAPRIIAAAQECLHYTPSCISRNNLLLLSSQREDLW
jgi:hypothetical protein